MAMVAALGGAGKIAPLMPLPPRLGGGGSAPPRPMASSTKVIIGYGNAPLRQKGRKRTTSIAMAASSGDIVIVETPGVRFGDVEEVEPETVDLSQLLYPS